VNTDQEVNRRVAAMSRAERAELWRRRLFEAEIGLTRHLVLDRAGRDLEEWSRVRGEVFADLPERGQDDPEGWQRVFFRAQALMERLLVGRYGHPALADWARRNAEVHRHLEPDEGHGALGPVLRIARQAELYGSRYRVTAGSPERAEVAIEHCAIWDYRERARSRGVPLTLVSPCEYCTHATSSNVEARGFRPRHELTEGPDGHGCRWQAAV
jgi:hypothetical protein